MQNTLPFYKVYPGGNPTILVWDNALFALHDFPEKRRSLAAQLMQEGHLGAEQVGFLDTSRALPHLEMMGGEFCVNAIRSAALVFAHMGLVTPTATPPEGYQQEWLGDITASGADEPVQVRVRKHAKAADYETALSVALPCMNMKAARELIHKKDAGEIVVCLPGITHILLDSRLFPLPEDPIAASSAIRKKYTTGKEDAVGVIWYGSLPGTTVLWITPVVHVAATCSSVAETACGSGSLALALWIAVTTGSTTATIRQPSGFCMGVAFEQQKEKLYAWVDGSTRLFAEGMAHIVQE